MSIKIIFGEFLHKLEAFRYLSKVVIVCRTVYLDLQRKGNSNFAAIFTPRPSEKSANPTSITSQRLVFVLSVVFLLSVLKSAICL